MKTIRILYGIAFAIAFLPNVFWAVPHMVEICFVVSFLSYAQFAYFSLEKFDKDPQMKEASFFTILFCLAGMILGTVICHPKVPVPPAALLGAVYGFFCGGLLLLFCECILYFRKKILSFI
jgi:hypothetical protein